jgi:hypothetical protein
MNTTYGIVNFGFKLRCEHIVLGKTFNIVIGDQKCKIIFPSNNEYNNIIEELKFLPKGELVNITNLKLWTHIQLTAPKIIEQYDIGKIEWGDIENLERGIVSINKILLKIDDNTDIKDWNIFDKEFTQWLELFEEYIIYYSEIEENVYYYNKKEYRYFRLL